MSKSLPKKSKLVPISEAAKVLGVSIDTVRRWDKSGTLHSQRPDGKNRFFSLNDLEKVKFAQPLPISEASERLGISASTLRRLEKKGLIAPVRNKIGERGYTQESLEKFLNSEYFMRQKEVEEKILEPLSEEGKEPKIAETKRKILGAVQEEIKQEVSGLVFFRRTFYASGLFIATVFIFMVALTVLLFLLYPENTARFFGYNYKTHLAQAGVVLGASFPKEQPKKEAGQVLGAILKPVSQISLGLIKQIDPATYEKIIPQKIIGDINDVFVINSQGDLETLYNFSFPDSSYLKIPDKGLVKNLNADYVRGKTPGDKPGDIAILGSGGLIEGAVDRTGITDIKSDSSRLTVKIEDNASTLNLDLTGITATISTDSVTSGSIKDGEVKEGDLADGAVTNGKLSQITDSNKVAGSAVQLATGGGLANNSGLTLLNTCSSNQVLAWDGSSWVCTTQSGGSEADTLATVTARGATTTTSVTFGVLETTGNMGIGSSLTISGLTVANGGLNVSGYSNLTGNVGIGGSLTVTSAGVFNAGLSTNKLCLSGNCKTAWDTMVTGESTTASNGLTLSGYDVQLGGSLTRATAIDIASQNFGFLGGNVGIGTSVADYNLKIMGTGYLSGFLGVGSSMNVAGNVGIGGTATFNNPAVFNGITNTGSITTTSSFLGGNGSAVSPAYSFSNSTGIGLWSPSSNALSLTTNGSGTSGITITAAGSVGIGITAPLYGDALEVSGTIRAIGAAGDIVATANLYSGTGIYYLGTTGSLKTRNIWDTGTASGNVGIGTTTPASKLGIAGNVAIGSNYGWLSAPANGLIVQGNVGIGTSAPAYLLDVNGNVGIGGTATFSSAIRNLGYGAGVLQSDLSGYITSGALSLSGTGVSGILPIANGGTNNSSFNTGGVTYSNGTKLTDSIANFYFDSANNRLGIGTSTPYSKLQVRGSGTTTGLSLSTIDSAGTQRFAILDNGNVGIGTTSPGSLLEIYHDSANGNLYQDLVINGGTQSVTVSGSGHQIEFIGSSAAVAGAVGNYGNGTVAGIGIWGATATGLPNFYVQSGGNVGIGTTNSGTKLSVSGNSTIGFGGVTSIAGPANGLGISGNLGVGTTTTTHNLEVIGTGAFSSTLSLSNGSATTPALNFSNLTNAGLWTNGDGLLLTTGGSNTKGITVTGAGNVGIGKTNPSTTLYVSGTGTFTGNVMIGDQAVEDKTQLFISKTFDASVDGQSGIKQWFFVSPTSDSTNTAYALQFTGRKTGTYNLGTLYGVNGVVANQGSGTLSSAFGINGSISLYGTGNGSITNGYAISAGSPYRDSTDTGTITTLRGVYINNQGNSYITNAYGLYIEDQTGALTKNYSIYSVGGTNYLGGNLGIGVSAASPVGTLQVGPGAAPAAFFVGSTGNVGIGTTSPNNALQVIGNVGIGSSLTVTDLAVLSNGLNVTGYSNLTGNVGVGGSATFNSAIRNLGYGTGVLQSDSQGYITSSALSLSGSNISGILPIANGGTSNSSFNTGGVAFYNGTKLTDSVANFYFDSTNNRLGIGTSASYGQFQVGSGVTPGLFVNTGNVGIGVTNPVSSLQISKATIPTSISAANNFLTLGGSASGTNRYWTIGLGYGTTQSPAYIGYQEIVDSNSTYGDLIFGTRNVTTSTVPFERMRIDNAGNVGIGNSNSGTMLSIAGNSTIGFGGATSIAGPSNGLAVSGNLGIGTTSPVAPFNIWGNGTNSALFLNGNIGIGTTAAGALLGLNAPSGYSSNLFSAGLNNTVFSSLSNAGLFKIFDSTGVKSLNLSHDGTDAIITASSGTVTIGSGAGTTYIEAALQNDTSSYNGNVQVIDNFGVTGNVGIGTSNPAYALDVRTTGTTGIIARFNSSNNTGCSMADGGTISCSSDINLKKNIDGLSYGLNTLMKLRPVNFNWKSETDGSDKSLGFIAQEVESIIPKLVSTDGQTGLKELNTIGLIPVLTKSIQEQQVQIESLTQRIATASANIVNLDALKTGAGLTVIGPAEFKDKTIFQALVEFIGNVIFHGDVNFEGRPTFNKDTAGSAVIKKDADSVDVVFEKEYVSVPLVNITMTLDNMVDASASASVQIKQEASQSAFERLMLDGDIKYIVTKRSVKGFSIKINKPAPADLTFSWSALAVLDTKVAVSSQSSVVRPDVLGLQASPSPEPTLTPEPTPVIIKINETPLGYLRVREEATTAAAEVGQVLPGETFEVLVEKNGWYEIEYKKDFYGWVKGTYVMVL